MKMFGSFTELQNIVFRLSGKTITLAPASQTGSPTINIPDTGTSGTSVLTLTDLAQTLTNKTLTDSTTFVANVSDSTKKIKFSAGGSTTGKTLTLAAAVGNDRTLTFPDATDTLVGRNTTDTLTNKTLDNTTTLTVLDANFTVQDNVDPTKQVKFEVSNVATGTTRSISVPDSSLTLVGTTTSQTLSNKVLDSTNNLSLLDTRLTIADNGDPTKSFVFQASGITTGTQRTLTVPDADTTIVGTGVSQTLTNKTLDNTTTLTVKDTLFTLQDNTDVTKQVVFELSGLTTATTRTLTIPDASTTLVGTAVSQTLTNKTIDGSLNTLSNVPVNSATGTLAIGHGGTGQTTASAAFDALSPLTTKGDLLAFSTTNARLPVGSDGQVLSADSTQTLGVKWISGTLTNPMTTAGDIIVGGSAGAATRLALGTANQLPSVNTGGTTLEYRTLSVGTSGTDFGVAFAANSITLNLPSASASNRGVITTGSQTIAGDKAFTGQTNLLNMYVGSVASAVSFSGTTYRYIGNKKSQILLEDNLTSDDAVYIQGGLYYDGSSNKFTTTNRNGGIVRVGGGNAFTSPIFTITSGNSVTTAADASATTRDVVLVDGNGLVTLAQGQISFPASQVASSGANVLDDYEEGTWGPTLTSAGGGSVSLYTTQVGTYTKIGRQVYVEGYIKVGNIGSLANGNLTISGLPYPAASTTSNARPILVSYWFGLNSGFGTPVAIGGYISPSASAMTPTMLTAANVSFTTQMNAGSFANASEIMVAATYVTAT